jgi:hypothetical protein
MTLAGSKANNPDRLRSPLRGLNPYLISVLDDYSRMIPEVGVEEPSTVSMRGNRTSGAG